MNPSQEKWLNKITTEFSEEIDEVKDIDIKTPIDEEYLRSLCEGDEVLTELFDDMITNFYRYTEDVCFQEGLKRLGVDKHLEEIRARDVARTAMHDSMIDSVKILVRNLVKRGKDTEWFAPIDKASRAGYATLALSTTLLDIARNGKVPHGDA